MKCLSYSTIDISFLTFSYSSKDKFGRVLDITSSGVKFCYSITKSSSISGAMNSSTYSDGYL